jgi:hypothetical protein
VPPWRIDTFVFYGFFVILKRQGTEGRRNQNDPDMTSISSIGATAPTQPARAIAPIERDGDNEAGKSAPAEASDHGPATQVTLSPRAQALLNGRKR